MDQKQSILINGILFQFVPRKWTYAQDGRVNNPVLGVVVLAADDVSVKPDDVVLLSHNMVFDNARMVDDGIVIPYDRWVLATVDKDGELIPTPENIIAKRVPMPVTAGEYYVPETARKFYADRVESDGCIWSILKWADYEVFYNWNGEERSRVVVWKNDIICKIQEVA